MKGGEKMKRFFKVLSLLLVLVLVIGPFYSVKASDVPIGDVSNLTGYTVILHTNDIHGRAVPDSYNKLMGFTAVSALKKDLEAAGAKVILLDAGDTLHGLPFATLTKGSNIVKLMNAIGYDAMTPGNHDFNYGSDTLLALAKTMEFPLLSSNITVKSTGKNFLQDSTIIEENGVKYGIFGVSTPETAIKTNPKNVSTIKFNNPIDAAKKEVTALKKAGADVIVALSHLGTDKSSEFTSDKLAKEVDGINLIVDGHSHSVYEAGLKVDDTLIVSTGQYIQNIGGVIIDKDGNMEADLVNIADYTKTDPAIDAIVTTMSTEQDKLLSEVVGSTSVVLDGVRENVRSKETNLGDLTADAMRDATGADVALTNGGGIRASIDVGDITKKELVTVFPFGNYVVTKKVTGKALLEALEVGVASYPEVLGAFPQVSGITFKIDVTQPAGSRVKGAKINGKAVDPKATYLLASNDFIFAGGDGYTMLADFKVEHEYSALEEIITNYVKKLGTVNIQTDNRIEAVEGYVEEVPEEDKTKDEAKEVKPAKETKVKCIIYVVKKGDSLSKIAHKYFGKYSDWKKIYKWNKKTIADPSKIYINQKIKIYL